jgi:hypothetical protein
MCPKAKKPEQRKVLEPERTQRMEGIDPGYQVVGTPQAESQRYTSALATEV